MKSRPDQLIDTNRGTTRDIVEVLANGDVVVQSRHHDRRPSTIAARNLRRYRVVRRVGTKLPSNYRGNNPTHNISKAAP